MSGMLNPHILNELKQAGFEKIVNYILEISEQIIADFEKNQKKMPNDENKIRSIMLEEYLKNKKNRAKYKMSGYKFDAEVIENYNGDGTYAGRVDIRIILKTDFEEDDACYIVECKRLDGTGNLNKKYVKEGIARFITEKYSSYYGRNILLGFVVKKIDLSTNTQLIENIQNSEPDIHMHGRFELYEKRESSECYKCIHKLASGELELRHIFSDFSDIAC